MRRAERLNHLMIPYLPRPIQPAVYCGEVFLFDKSRVFQFLPADFRLKSDRIEKILLGTVKNFRVLAFKYIVLGLPFIN